MTINEIREKITPILDTYRAEYAGVFGSIARGDAKSQSDVDIVVRVNHLPLGIWGMIGLKDEFEKVLGRKVDLLSEQGMSSSFASRIKKDLVTVYGQR